MMSMSGAEYQRKRRAKAAELNLCCECGCRPRLESKARCRECLVRAAKYREQSFVPAERRIGDTGAWCDECIASGFHRSDCPSGR